MSKQLLKRTRILSLLVIGLVILLPAGPVAGADDPDCQGCGWSECVSEQWCEEQTGCTNLSGDCALCAYTVTCGWHYECGFGEVKIYCDVEKET